MFVTAVAGEGRTAIRPAMTDEQVEQLKHAAVAV